VRFTCDWLAATASSQACGFCSPYMGTSRQAYRRPDYLGVLVGRGSGSQRPRGNRSYFRTQTSMKISTFRPIARLMSTACRSGTFKRREPLKRLLSGVAYVSKSLGFLYSPKMAKALDRLVPGVDVVHTHLPFIYPTYAAAHAAFRHGKSLFYHQRAGLIPSA